MMTRRRFTNQVLAAGLSGVALVEQTSVPDEDGRDLRQHGRQRSLWLCA
jgi:hypothetical protein